MILTAAEADGPQIRDIAARVGVFSQEEVECVADLWNDYLTTGPQVGGYNFIVEREGDRVLGFACYGPRDLTNGVYDLYCQGRERSIGNGTTYQRVLENPQVHAGLPGLGAQDGESSDLHAAVLGQNDGLGVGKLGRDLGHYSFFGIKIETHGPFSYQANN